MNWGISECLILEMWEDNPNPEYNQQEQAFRKMLVNNMQTVFKIFFRGMNTVRLKTNKSGDKFKDMYQMCDVEQSLAVLERKRIIDTRVRSDTGVK